MAFDFFKKKGKQEKQDWTTVKSFHAWIDEVFAHDIPEEVVGIVFNIYEDSANRWSIEAVGTASFDEDDDDWACDEVTDLGTRDAPFRWQEETSWEDVLAKAEEWLRTYLVAGQQANTLKAAKGVAVGFVDGDLKVLHTS